MMEYNNQGFTQRAYPVFADIHGNSSNTTTTDITPYTFVTIKHPRCEPVPISSNILVIVSCIMSIIGAVAIFHAYFQLPSIRNMARKMLLALTVADLLTAIGNLIGSSRYLYLQTFPHICNVLQTSDILCITQSFITTFSSLASFYWTVAIALHIVVHLKTDGRMSESRRALLKYHLVCWGGPGVITIVAVSVGALGQDNSVGTGGWCWIKSSLNDRTQVLWMVISGKGWEIFCYIATAVLYMTAKLTICIKRRERERVHFRTNQREGIVADFRREDENYLCVPVILYVLRVWGTARFFLALSQNRINAPKASDLQIWLRAFQCIGDSWQAFWNFMLFCVFDGTVRQYMFSNCCKRHRVIRQIYNDEHAGLMSPAMDR